MLESAGYTPRMIQEYLHLSCVQPIYRWYKGLILPSVDHLFMLSELLGVHMEEFLVKKNAVMLIYDIEQYRSQATQKRFIAYYKKYFSRWHRLLWTNGPMKILLTNDILLS